MTHLATVLFAPFEFNHADLVSAAVLQNFGGDPGAIDKRCPDFDLISVRHQQDFREFNVPAWVSGKGLDVEFIARTDTVLFSAGFNDCMHRENVWNYLRSQRARDSTEFANRRQDRRIENGNFPLLLARSSCSPEPTPAVTKVHETKDKPDIEDLRTLVREDVAAIDRLIKARLYSDVILINQLSQYIIASGGKRLRPLLALLSAKVAGYEGTRHREVAVIIELIHTATLLHDDVVDASTMRRGRETANLVWGNEASVLVGDFLYSRAFQMMVDLEDIRVLEILADATNTIAEGEVMQLVNCRDPDTSEARYLTTIHNKTAKLFEAAAILGAVVARRETAFEHAMGAFGRHIGTAFQLVDDALDYSASPADLGKNIGDDLAEGKPTLPLLYAMWNGTPTQAKIVREAIEKGGRERIDEISSAIESTGAIAYTFARAQAEADKALAACAEIPKSSYRDGLETFVDLAVNRGS